MKKIISRLVGVCVAGFLFVSPVSARATEKYQVKNLTMDFLMDAPLEKIKGKTSAGSGSVEVALDDLKKVSATIKVDLSKITLHTFGDAEKDKTQTDHMYNWFEIGKDVDQKTREKFTYAEMVIAGATELSEPKQKNSEGDSEIYTMKAQGTLKLHGITKTIPLELMIKKIEGGFFVKTSKPFMVTLADFDVKPRDIAGKLLQQTLASLGQKVASQAQVNLSFSLEQ